MDGASAIWPDLPYPTWRETAATLRLGTQIVGKIHLALTPWVNHGWFPLGYTNSAAEEPQKKLPGAKVVKAFNTVFAGTMDSGKVKGEQLTAFITGDDDDAKQTVLDLARGIGFDAGPLAKARLWSLSGSSTPSSALSSAWGPKSARDATARTSALHRLESFRTSTS